MSHADPGQGSTQGSSIQQQKQRMTQAQEPIPSAPPNLSQNQYNYNSVNHGTAMHSGSNRKFSNNNHNNSGSGGHNPRRLPHQYHNQHHQQGHQGIASYSDHYGQSGYIPQQAGAPMTQMPPQSSNHHPHPHPHQHQQQHYAPQFDIFATLENALMIAWHFIPQYYTLRGRNAEAIGGFYTETSLATIDQEAAVGIEGIRGLIMSRNFAEHDTIVTNLAAHHMLNSMTGGILITAHGLIVPSSSKPNAKGERRTFVQSFMLAPQMTGYFVLQDMLMVAPAEGEAKTEPIKESVLSVTTSTDHQQQDHIIPTEKKNDNNGGKSANEPPADAFKVPNSAPLQQLAVSKKLLAGSPSAAATSASNKDGTAPQAPSPEKLRVPADGVIPPQNAQEGNLFQAVSRASPTSSTGGIAGSEMMSELSISNGTPSAAMGMVSSVMNRVNGSGNSVASRASHLSTMSNASNASDATASSTEKAPLASSMTRKEASTASVSPKRSVSPAKSSDKGSSSISAQDVPLSAAPTAKEKADVAGNVAPTNVKDRSASNANEAVAQKETKKKESDIDEEEKNDSKKDSATMNKTSQQTQQPAPLKPASSWAAMASSNAEKWKQAAPNSSTGNGKEASAHAAGTVSSNTVATTNKATSGSNNAESARKRQPTGGSVTSSSAERNGGSGGSFSYDVMLKDVPPHFEARELARAFAVDGEVPEIDVVRTRQMAFLKYRNAANAQKATERKVQIGSSVLQCEDRVKRKPISEIRGGPRASLR